MKSVCVIAYAMLYGISLSAQKAAIPPIFYAIDRNADLMWYKHAGYGNGSFEWGGRSGTRIAAGWADLEQVFSDEEGHLYVIKRSGELVWYGHEGFLKGTSSWGQGSGNIVGKDWDDNIRGVFAGGGGVIYVIKNNGDLLWYRHMGFRDGTPAWHPNSGIRIGRGWTNFHAVFSGGAGIIYKITPDGSLYCYKHLGFAAGTNSWSAAPHTKIGIGWNKVRQVFSTGMGYIYSVTPDGDLHCYHQPDTTAGFPSRGCGKKVGADWSAVRTIGLGCVPASHLTRPD